MAYSGSWEEALQIIADTYNTSVPNVESVLNSYDIYSDPQAALAHFNETRYYAEMEKFNHIAANGSIQGSYLTGIGRATQTTNSNTVLRSQIRTPINSKIEVPAGGSAAKFTAKVGLRETGRFVFGEVLPAVAAAGWGISLGKTIDSALYNANPDFWDAHGMSTLNPETWNSITSDYDGIAGTLFNLVFGLDGDKAQAYLDEDAAAYMALWLKQQGVFNTASGIESTGPVTTSQSITQDSFPVMKLSEALGLLNYAGYESDYYVRYQVENYPNARVTLGGRCNLLNGSLSNICIILAGHNDSGRDLDNLYFDNFSATVTRVNSNKEGILSNKPVIKSDYSGSPYLHLLTVNSSGQLAMSGLPSNQYRNYNKVCSYENDTTDRRESLLVNYKLVGGIEGIGDQPGATLPDTTNWTDIPATKAALQQQYPNLWNNAVHNDYVDAEGNNHTKTYIPINLPNVVNKDDVQPVSGDRNQGDPEIDPMTAIKDLLDTISKTITQTPTSTDVTPTGSGSSPDVLPPTGSASSLWAVYNPTQAEVNAFGSWLWSSDLVEQIKKLFNDPMQAIIGIHKVFATPATSGTATIKCGYIDSQVSSAVVSNQYTTINCGTVRLAEYFGNIFDYGPYTEVSLYLPFIGIVRLDVSDIMRSSITVIYHVDVITGACLADVKISRDGANSVLYQYAGSCIVTYPLSSGSYASALAGIVSIAGGAIASVASGGALAPVAIGAAVGATRLHSDVQKSGSFTGAAGAMGSKKPYLIISRPQTAMPSHYKALEGQPASHYTKVSECSGFIKVNKVHFKSEHATSEEVEMIESLLKIGIEV